MDQLHSLLRHITLSAIGSLALPEWIPRHRSACRNCTLLLLLCCREAHLVLVSHLPHQPPHRHGCLKHKPVAMMQCKGGQLVVGGDVKRDAANETRLLTTPARAALLLQPVNDTPLLPTTLFF